MKAKLRKKFWILLIIAVTTLAMFGYLYLKSKPLIPNHIRKQVSFVILYPDKNNEYRVDNKSIVYDPNPDYKSLTYTAKSSIMTLTVVEQATPSNFTDIPQLYDKTVEAMNPYAAIDTKHGKVTLTHPPKKNNKQFGILNVQGTIVLVGAEKDMSDDQWRKFFNGLQSISP